MMKKILYGLILTLIFCNIGWATGIVNNSGSTSEDSLTFNILNLLPSGNPAEKLDSAYFTVFKSNINNIIFRDSSVGVSMTGVDSFVIGGDVVYYFHRAVEDIDGAGADGVYSYNFLSVYNDSSMRTPTIGQFQIINNELSDGIDSSSFAQKNSDSLHLIIDSLMAVLDSLQDGIYGQDVNIVSITDDIDAADSLNQALDGYDNTFLTLYENTNLNNFAGPAEIADSTLGHTDTAWVADSPGDKIRSILDTLQNQDDWIALQANIAARLDTLKYIGGRGLGIWIDSAAANTNTVIGTDGVPSNPVSTIAAAKTLATALGSNRYYIINGSTFNLAANDLPSAHDNFEFIGLGHEIELAFGSQSVNKSYFYNISLSGAMHASGSNAIYDRCMLGYISANYAGHAIYSSISDTLVMKNAADIDFDGCWSKRAGNNTPTLDLSNGSSSINIRHYSGGMRFMSGTTLDTISFETDGQAIISASNNTLHITIRGMVTITDSGTTTDLTKDAVFSRADAMKWVWSNIDTSLIVDTSLFVEFLIDRGWDEVLNASTHNIGASAGLRLRLLETALIIRSNTAQGPYGANNRIQLDVGASATDGAYDPAGVSIVGNTGMGQTRRILEYNGTTKVAYVNRDWKINPDATSEYIVFADAGGLHVNEGLAQGGTSNTITLNTLADSNNDTYIGQIVFLLSGTGQDQQNQVIGYIGATKVATMQKDWVIPPDTSTCYVMGMFQNTVGEINAALIDSLNLIIDSTYAVLDSIQIKFANRTAFDPAIDSVIVDGTEFAILNGILTSTVWAGSGLASVALRVNDSLLQYFTLRDGNVARSDYASNLDTVWVLRSPTDTIGLLKYFHPGGTAGDPADSIKYEDYP